METLNNQFKKLINGDTGNNTFGIPGTPHDIRSDFWLSFTKAFPEAVTLDINDVKVKLNVSKSESGKTITYRTNLTNDQYIKMVGSDIGLVKKKNIAYLVLEDGKIKITGNGKTYQYINNSNAEIL